MDPFAMLNLRDEDIDDDSRDDEGITIRVYDAIHTEISSLEKLCLDTIIHHFETFNSAFLTSQDEILKGNLNFLRRAYSAEILKICSNEFFSRRGCGFNSYLRFLINEYLQELKIYDVVHFDETEVLERIAEIGHSLLSVNFFTGIFPPISFKTSFINSCIRHLPNINSLEIPCTCTNETLKIISSSCPKLKKLHVMSFYEDPEIDHVFSEGGVKFLCSAEDGVLQPNRTLKTLSLNGIGCKNSITERDMVFLLEYMPSLERLIHSELPNVLYQLHKHDLSKGVLGDAKEYNLTSINLFLEGTELSSTVYEFLSVCNKVCPHLKKLSTWVSEDRELDQISLFPELETLRISGQSGMDMNRFIKLKGHALKVLILYHFTISNDVLIQSCKKLENLSLNDITFQTNNGSREGNSLIRLRKLRLCNSRSSYKFNIKGPINQILISCPNLDKLSMDQFKLKGTKTISSLSKFFAASAVKKISLRNCWIDPSLLVSIVLNCSYLKLLILKYPQNMRHRDIKNVIFQCVQLKRQSMDIHYYDFCEYFDDNDSFDCNSSSENECY